MLRRLGWSLVTGQAIILQSERWSRLVADCAALAARHLATPPTASSVSCVNQLGGWTGWGVAGWYSGGETGVAWPSCYTRLARRGPSYRRLSWLGNIAMRGSGWLLQYQISQNNVYFTRSSSHYSRQHLEPPFLNLFLTIILKYGILKQFVPNWSFDLRYGLSILLINPQSFLCPN